MADKKIYLNRAYRFSLYFIFGFLEIVLIISLSFGLRKLLGELGFVEPLQGSYSYYVSHAWWMWLTFTFIMLYEGIYGSRKLFWEEAKDIIKYTFLWMFVVIMVLALTKEISQYSRLILVFIWFFSFFLLPLFHYITKKIFIKLGIFNLRTLIIGAGNAGMYTLTGILKQPYLGYQVIGFCDDNIDKKCVKIEDKEFKILGNLNSIENIIKTYEIETVIVAITSLDTERLTDLTNKIHQLVRRIIIVPNIKGVSLTNSEINYLFDEQLFLLKISNNLSSLTNRVLKRTFDIVFSILILPFVLFLIIILGVLIKIDSSGPIFFVHKRIGKNGREIPVIKFRTMYRDAQKRLQELLNRDAKIKREWEESYKLKNDPRITRVGKFLRKTSLDELPQIFNVLAGHMSLVGPRPVLKEELDNFYGKYAEYYFMVPPGITGLWQVGGRSDTDYKYRVWLDTWYILNWSLWLDIVLVFKTIKVVFRGDGAY